MRIGNYEIRRVTPDKEIISAVLDKAEQNARVGLVTANLEQTHHSFLLKNLENLLPPTEEKKEEVEREIRLTKEAIERDRKSIVNWATQLRAIQHERTFKTVSGL